MRICLRLIVKADYKITRNNEGKTSFTLP